MKITKKDLLDELVIKQKKNISDEFLLSFRDLNRITKNINTSLFGKECCLWNGYVISRKNKFYIHFFFRKSKVSLIRLLYHNYVGKIEKNEYVQNECENGGKCCNITHYKKYLNDNIDNNDNDNDDNDDNDNDDIDDNNDDANLKSSKDDFLPQKKSHAFCSDIDDNNDNIDDNNDDANLKSSKDANTNDINNNLSNDFNDFNDFKVIF
jgi:hypothetical protein